MYNLSMSPESPKEEAQFRMPSAREVMAKVENQGYVQFTERIDRWEQLEREFGVITQEDIDSTKIEGVETSIEVENPWGKISGEFNMAFLSDTHRAERPTESIRQQLLTGYQVLRVLERLGYKAGEYVNGLKEAALIYPEVYREYFKAYFSENRQERVQALMANYQDELPPEVLKALNNPLAILSYEMSQDATVRAKVEKELGLPPSENLDKWLTEKQWEARNRLIEEIYPKMVGDHYAELPEGSTFMMMNGGDTAHDGGVKEDHLAMRKLMGKIAKSIPGNIRRIIAKIWGNHEGDAREPHVISELMKLEGPQIFFQEIESENGGEPVLIAGLNTFIMADGKEKTVMAGAIDTSVKENFWQKILNKTLNNKKYDEIVEERKDGEVGGDTLRVRVLKDVQSLYEAQNRVLEKIKNYQGKVLIVGHNPRRLEAYMQAHPELFGNNVVRIISGHTHKNETYQFKFGDNMIIVDTASGYIGITPSGIVTPEGIAVKIKDGDIKVERIRAKKISV